MCDDGWNWEDAEVVCIGTWVTLAIVVSLTRITARLRSLALQNGCNHHLLIVINFKPSFI